MIVILLDSTGAASTGAVKTWLQVGILHFKQLTLIWIILCCLYWSMWIILSCLCWSTTRIQTLVFSFLASTRAPKPFTSCTGTYRPSTSSTGGHRPFTSCTGTQTLHFLYWDQGLILTFWPTLQLASRWKKYLARDIFH